jgi:16S rRNA (uracil1498-N3)-methyltransferase
MRVRRVYQSAELVQFEKNKTMVLQKSAHRHVTTVLRLKLGDVLQVFDGIGHEYQAEIIASDKKTTTIKWLDAITVCNESPLNIHLLQGISRTEKMEWVIQKSVELGVAEITPLFTEHCQPTLSGPRLEKRLLRWREIIISASEQCGRSVLMRLNTPVRLSDWCLKKPVVPTLILSPHHPKKTEWQVEKKIALLVGPEGGFSDQEVQMAINVGCDTLRLGPRILRTETAAIAAIAMTQARWGDWG